jgi:hypothetical protein
MGCSKARSNKKAAHRQQQYRTKDRASMHSCPRSTNTVIGRTRCEPVYEDRAVSDSELRSSQRKPGTEAIDPARSKRAVRTIGTSPVNSASVLLNQSPSQQSAFHVAYTVNAADRNGPTSYQCHHPTKSSINTKRYHTHPNQIQFKPEYLVLISTLLQVRGCLGNECSYLLITLRCLSTPPHAEDVVVLVFGLI